MLLSGAAMSSYEDTLKITTDILAKHVDPAKPIRPNDNIQVDLGLDSLGVMEVVADIEDRFNVTIPNDVLSDIVTVEDVAKALVKQDLQRLGVSARTITRGQYRDFVSRLASRITEQAQQRNFIAAADALLRRK